MREFFNNMILNHKIILSYLAFFAGIGFGVAGLAIPPAGLLAGSVLILIGLLFILSAGFIGLDVKFDLNNKYFHARQKEISEKEKDIDKIRQAMEQDLSQSDIEEDAEP